MMGTMVVKKLIAEVQQRDAKKVRPAFLPTKILYDSIGRNGLKEVSFNNLTLHWSQIFQ